jgi:class 3 adenylate cyclase
MRNMVPWGELVERRLAAILVADVVGYSRLMGEDEHGTLAALKERRRLVLDPLAKEHGGRLVKVMGDGVLLEFRSAVSAVAFSLELHRRMAEMNDPLSGDKKIRLRIGVNLGDVIGQGNDIYGEGVNVAARLEAMAEPETTCVSAKIHDEVKGKLQADFVDIGEAVAQEYSSSGPGVPGQRCEIAFRTDIIRV